MDRTAHSQPPEWLLGGGQTGDLIRSIDWSDTVLGPRRRWPSVLRTVVQIVVESQFPMALLWGRELVMLYNEAYRVICAERHPRAMGRRNRDIWPEVWHINEPIFTAVMERGETIYLEDECFPIDRNGRREDAYFTLCYSPVRDEGGAVAGTLVTLQETTTQIAERRRLEQERERALDAFENGDACYVLDSQFRYVLVNRAQERSSGKNREQVLGRCIWDVWPEAADRKYKFWDVYHRVMSDRVPEQFEEHFPLLDLWSDIHVVPTSEGGIAAFFRRINDRKKNEERLRESEERHRAVVENLSEGLMLFSAEGTLVYQNPASARIHGFAPSEEGRLDRNVLTATWRGWDEDGRPLSPDEWPMFRVLRHERFCNQVLRAQRVETGREFYASYNGCPVYDAKGSLAFGFITIRDISDEVRAQQALRTSEEKFAKAFRGSAAAVTITCLEDGTFIDLNHTYTRITGYTRDDLVGKRPTIWKHAADRAEFVAALRRDGSVETVEVCLIKKNGEEWTGLLSAQVITLGGKEAVISSVVEITRRQRAEAELKEREADLRKALGRLAEADRRKDEFIAILSHELRNPLAPIRYALPVLERARLNGPATRAIEIIDRQLDHLTRLVDDLLDVSRITRGKIQLKREHVALGSIVDSAVEAASPAIGAARHTLEITVAEQPIWLYADAARVSQIITNLLNNSAKYTPRGGRITLEAGRDNGHACIRVRDNGMGIPADDLPGVFEMFRQVDRADKSQGGLGIGLALVKRLVEMHGGAIHAYSAGPGQGCEFTVRLPLAAEARAVESTPTMEAGPTLHRRLRVLIVDDNADLVEMLAMLVEACGHEVRKALDGRSALSAALSYHPDVALLDLGLPVMNGIEVARELRCHRELARTRLVALTGWGQAEDRRQTEDAGFDAHLTKPADPQQVKRLLEQYAAGAEG